MSIVQPIRLPEDLLDRLRVEAERQHRKLGALINIYLERGLKVKTIVEKPIEKLSERVTVRVPASIKIKWMARAASHNASLNRLAVAILGAELERDEHESRG